MIMPDEKVAFRRICIKCQLQEASPEFVISKDMAYCCDCAKLLRLGESKESKMFKDLQDGVPDPRRLSGIRPPEDSPDEATP